MLRGLDKRVYNYFMGRVSPELGAKLYDNVVHPDRLVLKRLSLRPPEERPQDPIQQPRPILNIENVAACIRLKMYAKGNQDFFADIVLNLGDNLKKLEEGISSSSFLDLYNQACRKAVNEASEEKLSSFSGYIYEVIDSSAPLLSTIAFPFSFELSQAVQEQVDKQQKRKIS